VGGSVRRTAANPDSVRVASALVGILLGAFAGGWLTDKFGRQVLFTVDLVAMIVCSIAQFFVGEGFSGPHRNACKSTYFETLIRESGP